MLFTKIKITKCFLYSLFGLLFLDQLCHLSFSQENKFNYLVEGYISKEDEFNEFRGEITISSWQRKANLFLLPIYCTELFFNMNNTPEMSFFSMKTYYAVFDFIPEMSVFNDHYSSQRRSAFSDLEKEEFQFQQHIVSLFLLQYHRSILESSINQSHIFKNINVLENNKVHMSKVREQTLYMEAENNGIPQVSQSIAVHDEMSGYLIFLNLISEFYYKNNLYKIYAYIRKKNDKETNSPLETILASFLYDNLNIPNVNKSLFERWIKKHVNEFETDSIENIEEFNQLNKEEIERFFNQIRFLENTIEYIISTRETRFENIIDVELIEQDIIDKFIKNIDQNIEDQLSDILTRLNLRIAIHYPLDILKSIQEKLSNTQTLDDVNQNPFLMKLRFKLFLWWYLNERKLPAQENWLDRAKSSLIKDFNTHSR